MVDRVRWGVLGTANIAVRKVIPAMQAGELCDVLGIASRDPESATRVADELGIPKSYGSYEEMLSDPEIEAVYIPLPNHLHVEWSIKAAEAGKHVLCEKPLGLTASEVRDLIAARDRTGMKIQEAFMVRTHPTWVAVREMVRQGRIGEIRAISGFFSYFNADLSNIRNKLELGGGGIMDIGCYCVNLSRFIFEDEPLRVIGMIERDGQTGTDVLSSAMMDFIGGQATFTCSTRLAPFQRMQICGTKGRIEVQIPFNIPPATPTQVFVDDGSDLYGRSIETIEFAAADQYTIQGDLFSGAIREDSDQAIPLEDSLRNMAAVDAIFRSAESGKWESPADF
jgi:predicted dehydrogenase